MKRWLALLSLAALVATAAGASAHVTGLSRGDYTPDGAVVHAEIAMRADEASLAGTTPAALVEAITMTADGAACTPRLDSADAPPARDGTEAPDGIRVRATFACPHAPARLHMHFGLLDRLPAGHRHLATVHLPTGPVDTLALLANPDLDVQLAPAPARATGTRVAIAIAGALALLAALATLAVRQRANQAAMAARSASRAGP